MMPANAHQLFKLLVEIATLNLLPTEVVIDEMEALMGISNDNFSLTDSFIDF